MKLTVLTTKDKPLRGVCKAGNTDGNNIISYFADEIFSIRHGWFPDITMLCIHANQRSFFALALATQILMDHVKKVCLIRRYLYRQTFILL